MAENRSNSRWVELLGDQGLLSKQWRVRLEALKMLLADNISLLGPSLNAQLLELLIFNLALTDTHSLVRKFAAECASKIYDAIGDKLLVSESDRYAWGFLTISMDKEREVQSAAVEALMKTCTTRGREFFKDMIVRLVHKFATSAILSSRGMQKKFRSSTYEGFRHSPDMSLLLPALEGVIHVPKIDTLGLLSNALQWELGPDLVPLLVAAAAVFLEESEESNDKPGVDAVSHLLRSLGLSEYRQSLLAMVAGGAYEGGSIAGRHRASGFLDDDAAGLLENLDTLVILKGLSIALNNQSALHDTPQRAIKDVAIQKLEAQALRHTVEVIPIPPELLTVISETWNHDQAKGFVERCYYYLRIVDGILNWGTADVIQDEVVQGLLLNCAAMASAEDDTPLSWIPVPIRETASQVVVMLGRTFMDIISSEPQDEEAGKTREAMVKPGVCVESLISRMLPALMVYWKAQLRDRLSKDSEGNFEALSSSVSLGSAIVAAHQMYWCLKQIPHPRLSEHCTLIMPCALMALDHYSPHIKRQAMKLFIHFTENLNPTELRWYRDAILDCITRTVIGCGDLWPLVVQTSVPLALCIEGNNARSKWYRAILNEMLGELERHPVDTPRLKVWLEHADKLFEAMGLVLVAHFKRLLPLVFRWLHMQDDSMTLLVLRNLQVIVTYTWPRMPFHIERMWKELGLVYEDSAHKRLGPAIRSSVLDVCELLKACGGPDFELRCQRAETQSEACFRSAVANRLAGLQSA